MRMNSKKISDKIREIGVISSYKDFISLVYLHHWLATQAIHLQIKNLSSFQILFVHSLYL